MFPASYSGDRVAQLEAELSKAPLDENGLAETIAPFYTELSLDLSLWDHGRKRLSDRLAVAPSSLPEATRVLIPYLRRATKVLDNNGLKAGDAEFERFFYQAFTSLQRRHAVRQLDGAAERLNQALEVIRNHRQNQNSPRLQMGDASTDFYRAILKLKFSRCLPVDVEDRLQASMQGIYHFGTSDYSPNGISAAIDLIRGYVNHPQSFRCEEGNAHAHSAETRLSH